MVKCDKPKCNEVLDYLPFKCKYCGGTYCKKHRLPENHECSFNMGIPINRNYSGSSIPTPEPDSNKKLYNNKTVSDDFYDENLEKEMEDFIEIQNRENIRSSRERQRRNSQRSQFNLNNIFSHTNKITATYWLMGLNVLFFIFAQLWPGYIYLNLINFTQGFQFHTIITSIFAPIGFISLLFSVLILFWTGRIIEFKYGSKFLIIAYFSIGFIAGVAGLLIQFIFQQFLFDLNLYFVYGVVQYFTSHDAIITGLIAFFCYSIGLEREMRFFLFFVPVRLKAKYIIWFLIFTSLLFGIIGDAPAVGQLASLTAIITGKYLHKTASSRTVNPSFRNY